MGRVIVTAKVQNICDLHAFDECRIAEADVRSVEVVDALVDTGATGWSMPANLLAGLGLTFLRTRTTRTSGGESQVRIFGTARLTVQGRDCLVDVTELADGCRVLIGGISLGAMDFVVDTTNHRLIGNPAHGGEHIIELS